MSHGQTLGRYTLIEQLAIGGMAEIWLAHMAGPEGFEKVVVIKKIRPHLQGQKNFLNMFLNEARLAAHLNHPNIVQIHEFGNPDNQYYIAMEYIFGRDLSEIVPKAKRANIPFPIEYASKIIAQVCEGLYYAHTKDDNKGQPLQIIHRDISPQNVLVSFDGHVKILDFGIAKAANQYEQTQQGILKGKVSYMSPEQILGDNTDCRADIFSLGAVFYELLTGYKLFSGDNELAILRSITDGPIYPPSYFNEDIPDELEEIIMKALAKDPNERYHTAWEMQRALNQLLIKFDFHPTNTHLANFLKQLFEDEIEQESHYLESKINEVVRGKSPSLGQPLHEEDEDEESSLILAAPELIEDDDEEAEEAGETQKLEEPPARKVNYDTRPDIDSYMLSEDDEIPTFGHDFHVAMLDDIPDTATTTPPETPPPHAVIFPDTQTQLMPAADDSSATPMPDTPSLDLHKAGTRHELNAVIDFADDEHNSPLPFDPSEPLDLSSFTEAHNSPSKQQPSPPELDDSISQILFTIRFASRDYDALQELAKYHNMNLEQMIHAMLQCARPFFESERNTNELDSAELDFNSSS